MPRRPAKLSNCYVPLPLPGRIEEANADLQSSSSSSSSSKERPDGRSAGHELRQLCLETSVISRAMGSSLIELGHTKVLAEVHIAAANLMGSRNNNSKIGNNEATTDVGSLKSNVKYAPHIGINQVVQQSSSVTPLDGTGTGGGGNNSAGTTAAAFPTVSAGKMNQELAMRESDLSHRLTAALLPVVLLDRYPKCTVVINATVLQDDGSCLSAVITAASMALVDARVEVRDLVTSCTVAVVEKQPADPTTKKAGDDDAMDEDDDDDDDEEDRWLYLADPTEKEATAIFTGRDGTVSGRAALICLAMTPNHKEVTLWSQSGRLSSEMASRAMELCRDGCRTMHKFMRESWMSSESSSSSSSKQ